LVLVALHAETAFVSNLRVIARTTTPAGADPCLVRYAADSSGRR